MFPWGWEMILPRKSPWNADRALGKCHVTPWWFGRLQTRRTDREHDGIQGGFTDFTGISSGLPPNIQNISKYNVVVAYNGWLMVAWWLLDGYSQYCYIPIYIHHNVLVDSMGWGFLRDATGIFQRIPRKIIKKMIIKNWNFGYSTFFIFYKSTWRTMREIRQQYVFCLLFSLSHLLCWGLHNSSWVCNKNCNDERHMLIADELDMWCFDDFP